MTTQLQFILIAVVGRMNRHQQAVIEYLQEENRVLLEQLGGKPKRFTDAQRIVNTAAQAISANMYYSFPLSSATPMNLSTLILDGAYGNFSNPGGYAVELSADGYSSIISTAKFTTQLPTFATSPAQRQQIGGAAKSKFLSV